MSYQSLIPLIVKTGSSLSPEQFQERINIVFHDFEASHYDVLHDDMRDSLQEQIDLLVNDLLSCKSFENGSLNVLDIGCGTGMSSQILLNSKLEPMIDHIALLDTSANMLKQAELKAQKWSKNYKIVHGYLSDLNEKFDVVLISSVLHHIPDLETFLQQVDSVMNSGGVLIHMQDPNADYLEDPEYLARKKEYLKFPQSHTKERYLSDLLPPKWRRKIKILLNRKDYIDLINDQLLAEKTIKRRMSPNEIWSVTDIHVATQNSPANKGISLKFLQNQLQNFVLIKMRSYGFYGYLKSDLTADYPEKESRLIAESKPNGRNLSAVWMKK
ncbi:MAG: class I SAM-dependent methyltransferase [Bacteroidetes bacterium]|nr:class I SAM-dependent methyltransferase [Bacteroidota bacterium]